MLLVELCTLIEEASADWTPPMVFGENLTGGSMPDDPLLIATLYDYTSAPPTEMFGNAEAIANPRVQLVVRASGYAEGRALIGRIRKVLLDFRSGTLSGVHYYGIQALDSPTLNDRDPKYRPVFTCNFQVMKDPSPDE